VLNNLKASENVASSVDEGLTVLFGVESCKLVLMLFQ